MTFANCEDEGCPHHGTEHICMTLPLKGDTIEITCGERTVEGRVVVMSPNMISALIEFEATLGKHAGTMPIMARSSTDAAYGKYHSIIDGTEITIKKKQP